MEREGLSPAAVFERLRATACSVGRTVGEVAGVVLAGQPAASSAARSDRHEAFTESRPLP
jgi:hypothetical protein